MLKGIGFVDPTEHRVDGVFVASSVEDYLTLLLEGSPLSHSLSEESEEVQKSVREKARRNISKYLTATGVSIPAECVIVMATTPS